MGAVWHFGGSTYVAFAGAMEISPPEGAQLEMHRLEGSVQGGGRCEVAPVSATTTGETMSAPRRMPSSKAAIAAPVKAFRLPDDIDQHVRINRRRHAVETPFQARSFSRTAASVARISRTHALSPFSGSALQTSSAAFETMNSESPSQNWT
ncbi:MAG: hypothetical protein WKF47_06180 [Geodermatophilaceae bacterium]